MSNHAEETHTYVLNPESSTEMARLLEQDRYANQNMGGVFVGLSTSDITGLHNVLDLACGPGGWVLDVAFENPTISVTGGDISHIMIDYAIARARTQKLTNTSFKVLDITKPLNFPDASFDLVNTRLLLGVLRREAWPPFIAECTRVLRPGGILRLMEPTDLGITNSPAQERLNALFTKALWVAGYGFSPDGNTLGMTTMVPRLLYKAGYQHLRYHSHAQWNGIEVKEEINYHRNAEVIFQTIQPFLVRAGVATQEEVQSLFQQMLIEINQDDFCGMYNSVIMTGYKPE